MRSIHPPSSPPPDTLSRDAPLDTPTAALLYFAADIAVEDEATLFTGVRLLVQARVPAIWVDELVLQSVLMVGWPRALTAAAAWRQTGGAPPPRDEAIGAMDVGRWTARGEETCRRIYGVNYDRLRQNVRSLHPALDQWMVTEGYGRTVSRPGLDLARRELCTVVQMTAIDASRQLHSHLRGALHVGASPAAVHEALGIGARHLIEARSTAARELWRTVRDRWERGS